MATIRPATASDHAELLAVWRRAVEGSHAFLRPADIDAIERDVASYLPRMTGLHLAHDGERIQGFVAADAESVEMLFVDPAAQGRGVGTALLDHAVSGHEVVRVDVNEQNPSARAFYSSRGFVEVGRSETDGEGRPFPILHLRRGGPR